MKVFMSTCVRKGGVGATSDSDGDATRLATTIAAAKREGRERLRISERPHGEPDPAPAGDDRDPEHDRGHSREPRAKRREGVLLPLRQIARADPMEDGHVHTGRTDQKDLGDEVTVREI